MKRQNFIPVLLGSDINVYGMARAFHEQYGVRSHALAAAQLAPTRYSRIVEVHLIADFYKEELFVDNLISFAETLREQNPDAELLLAPCGDDYSRLTAKNREQLKAHYRFNVVREDLFDQLGYKTTFYQTCEQYNLPYPKTFIYTEPDVNAEPVEHIDLPFAYPVALKAADSMEYAHIEFPERKKAYIIADEHELLATLKSIYAAGYKSEMIIQEYIAGDDSHMRVLNAYVTSGGELSLMFLGQPLLEDPNPVAIGNYAAILPAYDPELCAQIAQFLKDIKYTGFANFDLKVDPKDGQAKLFEINLRQGRSSYYVTLNGYNLASELVKDLIDGIVPSETTIGQGDKLWIEIPAALLARYAQDGEAKSYALQLLESGQWGSTLAYKADSTVLRYILLKYLYHVYKSSYTKCLAKGSNNQ